MYFLFYRASSENGRKLPYANRQLLTAPPIVRKMDHKEAVMEIRQLSKFDATVTSVFNSLLESFPTPHSLDAAVAGYEAKCGYTPVEGSVFNEQTYTHPSEDERFFADTIRWLASERYLTFKKEDDCKFEDVVATEKGLKLWVALPDSLS